MNNGHNKTDGKILPESGLENVVLKSFDSCDEKILERAPNLCPEDCSLLVYLILGYHLDKSKYFGLTFPLEDTAKIDELKTLSNGYIEIKDGVVRMGVTKLENLMEILRAPYIKPGSVFVGDNPWSAVILPTQPDMSEIKKELDMRRAAIKKEFERRTQKFEKDVEQHKETINAYKKQRDLDIARIQERIDRKTSETLKKLLREKDYERLQQWLLEKRKKESQELEKDYYPTEDEKCERQVARLQETDSRDRLWIYYLDNESKFREELKRDIGIEL